MREAPTGIGATRPDWGQVQFDSYLGFYRAAYGHSIIEERSAGRLGATLLSRSQSRGDWSDAAVPLLVITMNRGATVRGRLFLGGSSAVERLTHEQFVVVPPNYPTQIRIEDVHQIETVALPWTETRAFVGESWLPQDETFGQLPARANASGRMGSAIARLWAAARGDDPGGELAADAALLDMATALVALNGAPPPLPSGELAPWQHCRATEALEELRDGNRSIGELAALCDLSPFRFARAFKRSTGVPPHACQRRLRIERAKALLETTNLPVTEIALAVGYESSQALARLFAREVGCTPSRWRRERRG